MVNKYGENRTYNPYGTDTIEKTFIKQYDELLDIYPKVGDSSTLHELINNLVALHAQANYVQSLLDKLPNHTLLQQLFINDSVKLIQSICTNYNNIGDLHQKYSQYSYEKLIINNLKWKKKLNLDDKQIIIETRGEYFVRNTTNFIGTVVGVKD